MEQLESDSNENFHDSILENFSFYSRYNSLQSQFSYNWKIPTEVF